MTIKISQLGNISGVSDSTYFPAVDTSSILTTVKTTGKQIKRYIQGAQQDYSLIPNVAANVNATLGNITNQWTSIYSASVVGSSNVSSPLGAFTSISGNLITPSQTGITSVGTLANLTVTGNIIVSTGGFFRGNGSLLSGLPSYSNVTTATYLTTYTGNITAGNVYSNGNVTAQWFNGNGAFLSGLSVYSNVTAATYLTTYTGVVAASNVFVSGNVTAGNVNAATFGLHTGPVNAANVLAAVVNTTGLNASGTVYANAATSATSTTTGALVVAGGIGVGGAIYSTALTATNIYGSIITATQPNITTVGTLGSLNVTGNVLAAAMQATTVSAGNVYSTGNVTAQWFNGNASFMSGLPIYSNVTVATYLASVGVSAISYSNVNVATYLNSISVAPYSNVNVATYLPSYTGVLTASNVFVSGNVTAGNVNAATFGLHTGNVIAGNVYSTGNVTAQWFNGNAAFMSGLPVYSNVTVAAYLSTIGVSASSYSNVNAAAYLTSIGVVTYSNVNVASYLPTYTGVLLATNVFVTAGNVTASNVNAATFGLHTGNVIAGNVYSTGNVTAQWFNGNASFMTGLPIYSNVTVSAFLPTYSGIVTAGNVYLLSGNVAAQWVFGNGSQLSGLPVYSNVTAATYLTTYAGTATASTINAGAVNAPVIGNVGTIITGTYANVTTVNTNTVLAGAVSAPVIGNAGATITGTTYNAGNIVISTTGNITINNTAPSTSTTTGVLVVAGGVGVAGTIFAGQFNTAGNLQVGTVNSSILNSTGLNALGTVYANAATPSTSITTGAMVIPTGGLAVGGNLIVRGNINLVTAGVLGGGGNILINGVAGAPGQVLTQTVAGVAWSTVTAAATTTNMLISPTGGSNVTASASNVNVSINSSNVASFGTQGLSILTTAPSTSTITGALQVAGGVGVQGTVFAGQLNTTGNLQAAIVNATTLNGALATASQTAITAVGTLGSVNVSGNVLAAVVNTTGLNASGTVYANATTASTSTTTGALVLPTGGLAVGGTVFAGQFNTAGNLQVGTVNSSILNSTGLNVLGTVYANAITPSTSTTTGALILPTGGMGVAGNLNIGGNLIVGGGDLMVDGLGAYGNVGFGTNTPDIYLQGAGKHVGISSPAGLSILNIWGPSGAGINFGNSTTRGATIKIDSGVGHLQFYTNSGFGTTNYYERMRIDMVGNVVVTGNVVAGIGAFNSVTTAASTGAAGTAPLKLTTGTVLTAAEAGTIEYDSNNFYATADTTHGRNVIPEFQQFYLPAAITAFGPAVGNFFGATSAASLAANSTYDIECMCYFLKTTASTITWAPTVSSAATLIHASYEATPITGFTTVAINVTPPITSASWINTATALTFPVTGSLSTAVNHVFKFKIRIVTTLACNFRLNVTQTTAGTITPNGGSWYTVRRIVGNAGNFVA